MSTAMQKPVSGPIRIAAQVADERVNKALSAAMR